MKAILVLFLVLSVSQGFNLDRCGEDLEGLVVAYARAVYDWNVIVYYKQAVQEMGYALQYLGAALIDCNILSIFSAEYAALQLTGEKLTAFEGPVEGFTRISSEHTDEACEEKLQAVYESAGYVRAENKGFQTLLQNLHDFMATCKINL